MQEIIAEDIPYHRIECHTTEAVRIFSERGMNDKVRLLETSGSLYTYYYTLGDTVDYYYGNLLPSTGYLKPVSYTHLDVYKRQCPLGRFYLFGCRSKR